MTALSTGLLAILPLLPVPGDEFDTYKLELDPHPVSDSDGGLVAWDGVSGLTNDGAHWFIAEWDKVFWKVPVGVDLLTVTASTPGVTRVDHSSGPGPIAAVNHVGDLAYHEHGGRKWLVARARTNTSGTQDPGSLLFFDAETMNYVFNALHVDPMSTPGMLAIDADGLVYTQPFLGYGPTGGYDGTIERRAVDWDLLNAIGVTTVGAPTTIPLLFDEGVPPSPPPRRRARGGRRR